MIYKPLSFPSPITGGKSRAFSWGYVHSSPIVPHVFLPPSEYFMTSTEQT